MMSGVQGMTDGSRRGGKWHVGINKVQTNRLLILNRLPKSLGSSHATASLGASRMPQDIA